MEELLGQRWIRDKVKSMENDLKTELIELTNELDDNEVIHGIHRPTSSVGIPKDVNHFRTERELAIKRVLEVCEAQPLIVQSEVMTEELTNSITDEYTPDSLPLILHQYFTDRIQQLVQCKHMHMLRWKRFSEHTGTIEALSTEYAMRLRQIMSEYNDCIARAQRLSVARVSYLTKTKSAAESVQLEDLLIYLRFLVCHLHSVKRFNQFLKVVELLPITNRDDIRHVVEPEKAENSQVSKARIPARYQEDTTFNQYTLPDTTRRRSAQRPYKRAKPPPPPPINPTLLSPTPAVSAQYIYAAAAAGGGLASDEHKLGFPIHKTDLNTLRPLLNFFTHLYGISINIESLSSSADEAELYSAVNRKFRQIYARQVTLNTFRTYDSNEVGQENWGPDNSMHALKQESNWLPFVKLQPHRDPALEKQMVELRSHDCMDELLRANTMLIHVIEPERVQIALRNHAMMVREHRSVKQISVLSHHTSNPTSQLWKNIYSSVDLQLKDPDDELANLDDKDGQSSSSRKRKTSYDYADTIQSLGLEDRKPDKASSSNIQGAYLSFLLLRHLRIRDLQRTCLSILNYFRSVERTLTINDGGLSLESSKVTSASTQSHRKTTGDGNMASGGSLESHHYLHNTPLDYKVSETDFMEFSDIENHDDYYTVFDGRVHVQDQRGYYIMYDTAQEDLNNLESDLTLVGSFYLYKDRNLRSRIAAKHRVALVTRVPNAEDIDIGRYGHQNVDRYGVMLDLWSNETAFLECKKELLDCYMEAYQHVFDRDEKRRLAQEITDIIHQRPRLDFDCPYFIRSYRLECVILRHKSQLIKTILDAQIEEQRHYIQKVCREGDTDFGLPHNIIAKQHISVNMSRSSLRTVYMLEFHPSLATASRLPQAIDHALAELSHIHNPSSQLDKLLLERMLLERCQSAWEIMPAVGASFNAQVQKDLFADVFVEDPLFINEMALTLVMHLNTSQTRATPRERRIGIVSQVGRVMETITTRHRLIEAAWETEILSKVYKTQSKDMGYDPCHLFLNIVQFEFATYKHDAGRPPPLLISSNLEDDVELSRYVPTYLYLAIHELDSGHVGRFSFRSREGFLQLMGGIGMESLQIVLAVQIVHKNALITAITLSEVCHIREGHIINSQSTSGLTALSSTTLALSRSTTALQLKKEASFLTAANTVLGSVRLSSSATKRGPKKPRLPEAFMSLQLEKAPSRDLIVNEYITKKRLMGSILQNPEEVEKLKQRLIRDYAYRFNKCVSQYSLRGQVISYYNAILRVLDDFPDIRDTHFLLGEPREPKMPQDTEKGLEVDPSDIASENDKHVRRRPRRVLSADGQMVLNIWFIPHHTEVIRIFKELDEEVCRNVLHYHLRIVSALHDIIQYLCALSRLGNAFAETGSNQTGPVSADWGGTLGIGVALRELQKQIDHLEDRTNPEQVCTFLTFRRDVMFLQFDTAVRHSMRDTFLSTGNSSAFKIVTQCMHFALDFLSNTQKEALCCLYLPIPEPLEARDTEAQKLFPWRSFMNRYGPFPVHFWQWFQIEKSLQLCLAGLNDVDRHVANGEILGVSLIMEDVLSMGHFDQAIVMDDGTDSIADDNSVASVPAGSQTSLISNSRSPSAVDNSPQAAAPGKATMSAAEKPIEAFTFVKKFLLLWKRLEILKVHWGSHRLQIPAIDTTQRYRAFSKEYKKDVLFPVLANVARRYGQSELYEGMVNDEEPLVTPYGASETEIKLLQLMKLLEAFECHMMIEVRKKIARELSLVLAERGREELALPTDLWKRPSIKESYTINKPHIAHDFIEQLMVNVETTETTVTFTPQHLNTCLNKLSSDIMIREKRNYENYSMYYENLLKTYHHLLYSRQQEIKMLKDQAAASKLNVDVQVQCQMADHAQDLLIEITGLRTKIADMFQHHSCIEVDLRKQISDEYHALIHNLFTCTFELKKRFELHRDNLHKDVMDKIDTTRIKAANEMASVQLKSGMPKDNALDRQVEHSKLLHAVRSENHDLNMIMTKMKVMGIWRQNHHDITGAKQIASLSRLVDATKKQLIMKDMVSREEIVLLREQLTAVRHALKVSETEAMKTKKQLEKELRTKKEYAHAEQQRNQSQKHLEEARKESISKMTEELEDKGTKLQNLSEEQSKTQKRQFIMVEKVKKDVISIKKQLSHERSLKIDAFQRVDDLQTQIYDIETGMLDRKMRPHTAAAKRNEAHIVPVERPRTASCSGISRTKLNTSRTIRPPNSATGGLWPPPVHWPANRSLSPATEQKLADHKNMSQFRGGMNQLKSRIAQQLLDELEPPDHKQTMRALGQVHKITLKKASF